jgi:type II secretory ATPase GspE/PulE/Tfp pilus assembly ATPase PilB-like protein
VADSLIGVVSQRLVRKICNNCRTAYRPTEREKHYLGDPGIETLQRGEGCDVCGGTGYFGRTLVYELVTVSRELALLVEQEADLRSLMEVASQDGYVDMFDITVEKVKRGITTAREAMRTLGNVRQS